MIPIELLAPVRSVTADEVARFAEAGVVHLVGILDQRLLEAMAEPLERVLTGPEVADLGAMLGSPGPAFAAGTDHFRHHDEFEDYSCRSPLPEVAASLLGSDRVWLVEDSVLVKEPGSPHRTQFHTDLGYFHLSGTQICTTWAPLDPAGPASGMVQYLPGSHRWPDDYRPNFFVDPEPLADTTGEVVPDILADPTLAERLVTFTVQPGDVVVHHARTLHGGPPNTSITRRRAISVRYAGEDVRHLRKPGLPATTMQVSAVDGTELGGADWPQVHGL